MSFLLLFSYVIILPELVPFPISDQLKWKTCSFPWQIFICKPAVYLLAFETNSKHVIDIIKYTNSFPIMGRENGELLKKKISLAPMRVLTPVSDFGFLSPFLWFLNNNKNDNNKQQQKQQNRNNKNRVYDWPKYQIKLYIFTKTVHKINI